MSSCSIRIACAALVAGASLLAGCSEPGGTAVLEFGDSDPLNGGMRPIPDTLRTSIRQRFGQFGELRVESMDPVEIPHTEDGTTFISHRYRLRVTFVDDLDAGQRRAIREIFDTLHAERENWPRGITVDGHTSRVQLGDGGASLIYYKQYRYGVETSVGDYPTHCTVRLEFEPPLPGDAAALAAAADQGAIDFDYAPLQQAFEAKRFELAGSDAGGWAGSDELHHIRLDFGVIGNAIDMGPGRGGMASSGSTQKCYNRVADAGRPFSFDVGWTLDRARDVELDFPEAG